MPAELVRRPGKKREATPPAKPGGLRAEPYTSEDDSVYKQALALLAVMGIEVPVVSGAPTLSHQVVAPAGAPCGLHLFRLPAHDGARGSLRWRGVLDETGSLLDLIPVTTGDRKRLRSRARSGRLQWAALTQDPSSPP